MTLQNLTLRQLNRATLARQMLLKRETISVMEAVERLIGLQAQIPNPPYIGLWTRLVDFQRDDLTRLMEERRIVRAAMMRSTLHLMTAADHQRFRPVIEPALVKALGAFFGKSAKGLNAEKLIRAARPFLEAAPRSTGDLKTFLLSVEPDQDADAMAYLIRTYLPLVQIPPGGTWGSGSMATYSTADQWLGENNTPSDLMTLFCRYLATFGPASIMDFQTWTGMTNLKNQITTSGLVSYRDEQGRELFDLPDMPLPAPDTPAPVRFIPEYDNLLIAHADRTRVISDQDRPKVFLSAARVLSTVLVDGFVRGTWKISKSSKQAQLTITPFIEFDEATRMEMIAEGERLLRFVEESAKDFAVAIDA